MFDCQKCIEFEELEICLAARCFTSKFKCTRMQPQPPPSNVCWVAEGANKWVGHDAVAGMAE